jgi:hypothetical protein
MRQASQTCTWRTDSGRCTHDGGGGVNTWTPSPLNGTLGYNRVEIVCVRVRACVHVRVRVRARMHVHVCIMAMARPYTSKEVANCHGVRCSKRPSSTATTVLVELQQEPQRAEGFPCRCVLCAAAGPC